MSEELVAEATAPAPVPESVTTPPILPEPTTVSQTPAEQPDWPEDWRDRFTRKAKTEDREKLGKRLARFASPDNILNGYLEMERRMSAGELKQAKLSENASEEDIAAYRKAWGIPETPEGYNIPLPEGFSESDKADFGEFLGVAHKLNMPASQAQGIAQWYLELRDRADQQLYDAAAALTVDHRATLKAEYGRDFNRNIDIAKADLATVLGSPDSAEALVGLTLADATKLGDNPAFIRYAVAQALGKADETMLVASQYDAAGKSLQEQYREALDLQATDRVKYHTPEHQDKLMKLSKAVHAQRSRAA